MLSVNHMQILKEIQSLSQEADSLRSQIQSEQSRVDKIKALKQQNIENQESLFDQIKSISAQIQKSENELEKNESQLNSKTKQLELVTNEKQLQSIENEIKHFNEVIPDIEMQVLELYEQNETLGQEKAELDCFFQNIDQTIKDIELEALSKVNDYNQKIEIIDERIKHLEDELPSVCTQKLSTARKRKLNPFLSIIRNNSCQICGIEVSSQELTQIQNLAILAQCQGCSRLLIF